jgi:hypothetical protein
MGVTGIMVVRAKELAACRSASGQFICQCYLQTLILPDHLNHCHHSVCTGLHVVEKLPALNCMILPGLSITQ